MVGKTDRISVDVVQDASRVLRCIGHPIRLRIIELAVPRVYLDITRSFGGALDDGDTRMAHYRDVLDRAVAACQLSARALGTKTC